MVKKSFCVSPNYQNIQSELEIVLDALCLHGYTVDVEVVAHNTKDVIGHSQRKQLEVDFVYNCGP